MFVVALPLSETASKRICFIYTPFQRVIFLAIIKQLGISVDEFGFVVLDERLSPSLANTHLVAARDRKFSLGGARQLIKNILSLTEKICGPANYELWLASDDNPIGQILINDRRCKRLVLFEDGLGSYIPHSMFDRRKTWISTLARLRNIVYLFPRYRSLRSVGSSRRADQRFALSPSAFPGYSDVITIERNSLIAAISGFARTSPQEVLIEDQDIILLEQPIIEDKLLPPAVYREALVKFVQQVLVRHPGRRLIFKPHPRSDLLVYRENLKFVSRCVGCAISEIPSLDPLEVSLAAKPESQVVIAAPLSTALYVSRIIAPDTTAYCMQHSGIEKKVPVISDYIKVLKSFGVVALQV